MAFRKHKFIILSAILGFTFHLSPKAQAYFPGGIYGSNFVQWAPLPDYYQINTNRQSNQKWFVSKYAALSAGTAFYPGGNAFILSAPVGVQLNRQITNNVYAFAGVYAAPTFTSFNQSFLNPSYNKAYPGLYSNPYNVGINPGVQMGLLYVNDAGTFSISGSVRFQRNTYSYPVYSPPANNTKKR